MTATEEDQTETDPSRWPIPNGTLLSSEGHGFLDLLVEYAGLLQGEVLDLIKNAPVKAHDDHAKYLHDLGTVIDKIETAVDSLKETRDEAAAKLATGLPFGTAFVAWPDVRPMKPRFPKDRTKWDNELLNAAVLRRILEDQPDRLVDPDTGQPFDPRETVDAVLDVVSLNGSNAKVGGIKRLGLDPDDYCHAEKAAPTVQVTKS